MARPLPTSSYAVLGLLSLTPMSGYDLAQAVDKSIGHFWPMSKTQVYSELGRLDSLGLVEGHAIEQERLPDKRVFRLTEAGSRALDQWLDSQDHEGPTFRIPALVKIFFGHRMSRERVAQVLEDVAGDADAESEQLRGITELLEQIPKAAHPWASALYGLRMSEACAAWSREVRDRLAASDWARGHHDASLDSELARDLFEAAPAPRRGRRRRSGGPS
ncbi:MAG TPA: PadR family transcriptional regulator [Candidatus Dormibacteraeota bacterium]